MTTSLLSLWTETSLPKGCVQIKLKRKYPVFFCIWIQLSNGFSKTTKRGSINQRDEKVWPSSIKTALCIRSLFVGFIRSLVNFFLFFTFKINVLVVQILFFTFLRYIRRGVWKYVTLIEWFDERSTKELKIIEKLTLKDKLTFNTTQVFGSLIFKVTPHLPLSQHDDLTCFYSSVCSLMLWQKKSERKEEAVKLPWKMTSICIPPKPPQLKVL